MDQVSKKRLLVIGLVTLILVTLTSLLSVYILDMQYKQSTIKEEELIEETPVSNQVVINPPFVLNNDLKPLNFASLTKQVSEEYCEGIPTGIVTFRQTSEDQYSKSMTIYNRNNVNDANPNETTQEVLNIVNSKSAFPSEPYRIKAFNTYCSGALYVYMQDTSVGYTQFDLIRAGIYLGGTQYVWANLEDIDLTIVVYGVYQDNLIALTHTFEGSEVYTASDVQPCKIMSEYNDEILDMNCLANGYKNSSSMQSKIKSKTEELIKFFEF